MTERQKRDELVKRPQSEFVATLENRWRTHDTRVCVGLDTDLNNNKFPAHLRSSETPQYDFNVRVVDATHDLVCAYKPNIAFYEARKEQGIRELKMTVDYVKDNHPEIPVILDAKRADIGNTNLGYVRAAFDELGVDAITVHPYLGREALKPFLERSDKGIIVLARTSNPGAGEFQDLPVSPFDSPETDLIMARAPELFEENGTAPVWAYVAASVALNWNGNGNCGVVAGATYPGELETITKIVGDMYKLIPGIGKQGGDVEKTVVAGKNSEREGMIINSSRGIIFASSGQDFADAARAATERLREEINRYR